MAKNHKASKSLEAASSPKPNTHDAEGNVALYVHLPYCVKKCRYCDFNSYAYTNQNIDDYLAAVLQEARLRATDLKPHTLFVGGGTPTLVEADKLKGFLDELNQITGFADTVVEATIEANPESFDDATAHAVFTSGINRLSLGFQSLRNDVLLAYDRVHDVDQSFRAFQSARNAGFDNINIDLIYSFPGQLLEEWLADLESIHALSPEHLSCYELSYEPGTGLTKLRDAGRHHPNTNEFAKEIFEQTRGANKAAGYHAYEVSAFSKTGRECKHNLAYWNSSPYIGLGAGAASWANPYRIMNIASPEKYIGAITAQQNFHQDKNLCSPSTILFDVLMMGLRLENKGISLDRVTALSGLDARQYYSEQWGAFVSEGLIDFYNKSGQGFVRATEKGYLHLDTILAELLPHDDVLTV
ncbi:MAG: radical SAM family heme chaperone HemW [Planctomycetota bacterium]|nr:radical SAM family heme chaperone HemW [Planctomycetota bacterium]